MFLSKRRGLPARLSSFFPMILVLGVIIFVYMEYMLTLPASFYHKRKPWNDFNPSWQLIILVYLPFHGLLAMLLWSYFATTFTHGGRIPPWYTHYYREFNLQSLSRQRKGLILIPQLEADQTSPSTCNEEGVLVRVPRFFGSRSLHGASHGYANQYKPMQRGGPERDGNEEAESLEEEHPLMSMYDSSTHRQHVSVGEHSNTGDNAAQMIETREDVEGGSIDGNLNGDGEVHSAQPSGGDCSSEWAYAHTVSSNIAALHPYGVRWCEKCQTAKPPRSHHCHLMNECILKMDHYCPWVSNCVGFRNYKQFFLFLFYGLLLCSYVLITWVPAILEGNEHGGGVRYQRMTAFVLVCSFTVSLVGLGAGHTYFILVGKSTLEVGEDCEPFPFDFGLYNNWILVMGKDWKRWFLPIHTLDTSIATLDGTLFTKNRIENM